MSGLLLETTTGVKGSLRHTAMVYDQWAHSPCIPLAHAILGHIVQMTWDVDGWEKITMDELGDKKIQWWVSWWTYRNLSKPHNGTMGQFCSHPKWCNSSYEGSGCLYIGEDLGAKASFDKHKWWRIEIIIWGRFGKDNFSGWTHLRSQFSSAYFQVSGMAWSLVFPCG